MSEAEQADTFSDEEAEREDQEEPNWWEHGVGEVLAYVIAGLLMLALLGLGGYAAYDAITADRPKPQNPTFLDTIIASDSVVAAIRIAVIASAIFMVVSVIALISRRQWLTGFGPVRVGQSVEELNAAYQVRTAQLYEAQQTIDELEEQLNATNSLLSTFLEGDTINDPGSGEAP